RGRARGSAAAADIPLRLSTARDHGFDAAVVQAAGEPQRLISAAVQLDARAGDLAADPRAAHAARELLERLLELCVEARAALRAKRPSAVDVCRNDPKIGGALAVAVDEIVRLPLAHRERVRHDARAGRH